MVSMMELSQAARRVRLQDGRTNNTQDLIWDPSARERDLEGVSNPVETRVLTRIVLFN